MTTSPGRVPYGGSGDGRAGDGPIGLREDVGWFPRQIEICDRDPSVGTLALGISRATLGPVGAIGGLVLLWFVVRRARRGGVFGDGIPKTLRLFAYYLLAWAAISWLWTGIVDAMLLGRMAGQTWLAFGSIPFISPHVPVVTLLIGLGLVTLARVMSEAVALREDSEATI